MKEKGCLREVVPWAEARRYFYWRLRRRLLEVRLEQQIVAASGPRKVEHSRRVAMTRRWFAEDHPTSPHLWDEDKEVVAWLESQVEEDARCTVQDSIKLIRKEAMMHSVKDIGPELAGDLIMYLAEKLSPEKRDEMTKAIGDLGEVERDKSESVSPSPTSEGETSP